LVHGRDRARGESVLAEVRVAGCLDARLYLADFGVLTDTQHLADAILASEPRLHALVNNAGIIQDQRQESADGHELTLQVNYLAGFLLTRRLLPLLKSSAPSRIVNVASAGQAPIAFDDIMLEQRWDGWQAYSDVRCQGCWTRVCGPVARTGQAEWSGCAVPETGPSRRRLSRL
jgi:NAD(P)-dependent dehydrogenase (short-subunit alcohol dehydrogenase family)